MFYITERHVECLFIVEQIALCELEAVVSAIIFLRHKTCFDSWSRCRLNAEYGLDGRGFESRQGLGIFQFTTASRPALEPTEPLI